MKNRDQKTARIAELGKELQSLMYDIGMTKPAKGEYGSISIWDKHEDNKGSVHFIDHIADADIEIEFDK